MRSSRQELLALLARAQAHADALEALLAELEAAAVSAPCCSQAGETAEET